MATCPWCHLHGNQPAGNGVATQPALSLTIGEVMGAGGLDDTLFDTLPQ